MLYRLFVRRILFLLSPETVHQLVVGILKFPLVSRLLRLVYDYRHPLLQRTVAGISFPNPVGLAAGFDKDAELYDQLGDLGFGFIEIGTVTPRPQPGNPRPRIFRLPEDQALINRMGFNNQGVDAAGQRLRKRKNRIIIGGNIGKNRTTPLEQALDDYEACFHGLYDVVDFLIVNVSSPNTPHLRELQDREPLRKLLSHLKGLASRKEKEKPIFLKIAPDLNDRQLDDVVDIVRQTGIGGVVATNTTVSRAGLTTAAEKVTAVGEGGLSGIPLRRRSTEVIRYLRQKLGPQVPIIGVGGIHSAQDAMEKLEAGANLIELYTGFIYEGPSLIKSIKKQLTTSGYLP